MDPDDPYDEDPYGVPLPEDPRWELTLLASALSLIWHPV